MNTKNEFKRIMREQTEIALATSVDNEPNVRIVNFYYDDINNVLYFSTFNDNQKIQDFSKNDRVAFTTIPRNGIEHVKAKAIVLKSDKTIYDLKKEFISKIDGYDENIEQTGEFLDLYEIKFSEATVTIDFENIDVIIM